jgi:hypothetical protein
LPSLSRMYRRRTVVFAVLIALGCRSDPERDAGAPEPDAALADASTGDAGTAAEANIHEVLDCGDPTPVQGMGRAGELQLHELDTARFPDALCNDGTAAVIRFRPHRGAENENRWVISLRGGGACGSGKSCAARWCSCAPGPVDRCPFTDQETNFTLDNMSGGGLRSEDTGGILRRDAGPNPIQDFNQVELVYCSSDSWTGRSRGVTFTTPHPITGEEVSYTLHFLGRRILESDIELLRQDGVAPLVYTLDGGSVPMPDLDDATQVLFAGDSAGGAGVISNLDSLRDMLAEHHAGGEGPEVIGLIDAVTGPEWSRLDWSQSVGAAEGIDTYEEAIATIAADPVRIASFQEESCLRWHMENEPQTIARCHDETHILRHHITTPFFVRMALLDHLIAHGYEDLGLADPELGPFVDAEVAPGVRLPIVFGRVLQRELAALPMLPDTAEEGDEMTRAPGVFAPACSKHDTIHTDDEVYGVTIAHEGAPLRLFDVIGHWTTGSDPAALLTSDPMREDTVCAP